MQKSLYEIAVKMQSGGERETLELLSTFEPVIHKYGRLLDGEDTKQDLKLHLLKAARKMPLEKLKEKNNKVIFSYLAKSLKYEFIRLSKKNSKKIEIEQAFEVKNVADEAAMNSEIELLEMMEVLTAQESFVIECMYVNDLSATELAQYMKISRQAVNQTKNRALEKIKCLYFGQNKEKRKPSDSK
ncbi:RNA polymerase sigma factor [Jeotgalibacillus haloalkalitolerans]|uniref:Sigma-70 family RNA polymerase sigma factor n=1 Tax=Jeotgalibacillus haloalkalitolerans TaxID=3104292 RepID=A0ABU5KRH0_9BACL|nr:sigma-70 family RNA polymerase sigma factor [Jeotgalibacillus sp. HH7-29]MDZ5713828.1 sigma-70 family RNA polymerase sigma factor [Jeotgalibacillus sp. HH7-29]